MKFIYYWITLAKVELLMRAEIINIGDELLIGQTINTNGGWLGRELSLIGIETIRSISIADRNEDILNQLKESSSKAELVIITGGLGPTKDDITKHTLCEYFNTSLVKNLDIESSIRSYFEAKEKTILQVNLDQALLPKSCIILPNKLGTASGMWFDQSGVIYVALPGVPYEMKHLMETQVLPKLSGIVENNIFHRTVKTIGVGESILSNQLCDFENRLRSEGLGLAYLPSPGTVKLRISSQGLDNQKNIDSVSKFVKELGELIPELIYGYDDDEIIDIVSKTLKSSGQTVSVCESCSGGYLSHLFTSKSGSSEVFLGGVVAYSNEIKKNILGVKNSSLGSYGAVSTIVVEEMVRGGLKTFGSDYCIAISGIAGPNGGSIEKPVGLVYVAIGNKNSIKSFKFQFGNTRINNIKTSAIFALNELRKFLLEET